MGVPGAILATLKLRDWKRQSGPSRSAPEVGLSPAPEFELPVDEQPSVKFADTVEEDEDLEDDVFEMDDLVVVPPGSLVGIDLPIASGVRIKVRLEADEDFEFDLCTERNYVHMVRGEDVSVIRAGEDERAYVFTWKSKGKGPWTLVLSANGRRNVREVSVKIVQEP